jgi:hypothetical protein
MEARLLMRAREDEQKQASRRKDRRAYLCGPMCCPAEIEERAVQWSVPARFLQTGAMLSRLRLKPHVSLASSGLLFF